MYMFRLVCGGMFLFLLQVTLVEAASLYISPNSTTLYRGDNERFTVRLDVSEDQCVNAVDAVVQYSDNIEPVDVSTGGSIFSIWIEEPTIDRENRTVSFAGGIPNGYCGRIDGDPRLTNGLVDIIFQSPGFMIGGGGNGTSSDEATLSFADSTAAYLNDGFGTQIPIETYGTSIELIHSAGSSVQNDWVDYVNEDVDAPNAFSINLETTSNAFSGDYFITFNTSDKQSGVSYYEVMEEPLDEANFFRWGSEGAPWIETRSPYVLKDQSLNSTIYVRAVDKAGNEYMAVLVPDEELRTISTQAILGYVVMAFGAVTVVVVLGATAYVVRRRLCSRAELED